MFLKDKASSHSTVRNAFYAMFATNYQMTGNWENFWNNRKETGEFHLKKTKFKQKIKFLRKFKLKTEKNPPGVQGWRNKISAVL